MDEDALVFPEGDSTFYFETLFDVMKECGFFSISKNYRNLHYYSRVYVMRNGSIIEKGHPLDLVDN